MPASGPSILTTSAGRPANRPFAGISANDPDGNVFDISQKDMSNRSAIYVENDGQANSRRSRPDSSPRVCRLEAAY